jgi:hypothetical protein
MHLNPGTNPFGYFLADHLRPPRSGIDMTMAASLVAFAADVDLQGLKVRAAKAKVMLRKFLIEAMHISICKIRIARILFSKLQPVPQSLIEVFFIETRQPTNNFDDQTFFYCRDLSFCSAGDIEPCSAPVREG